MVQARGLRPLNGGIDRRPQLFVSPPHAAVGHSEQPSGLRGPFQVESPLGSRNSEGGVPLQKNTQAQKGESINSSHKMLSQGPGPEPGPVGHSAPSYVESFTPQGSQQASPENWGSQHVSERLEEYLVFIYLFIYCVTQAGPKLLDSSDPSCLRLLSSGAHRPQPSPLSSLLSLWVPLGLIGRKLGLGVGGSELSLPRLCSLGHQLIARGLRFLACEMEVTVCGLPTRAVVLAERRHGNAELLGYSGKTPKRV